MGTGPMWVHVKQARSELEPPLLQAEVHARREAESQESGAVIVTQVACETGAG